MHMVTRSGLVVVVVAQPGEAAGETKLRTILWVDPCRLWIHCV
jgi:hypothetical protein